MKILVVLACIAAVTARPEAPLQGYNYARPAAFPAQAHSQNFAVSSSFQAAPAPQYHAPAPAPQYHAPAPAPQYHAPAPAPQYQAAPAFPSSGFGSAISSAGAHAQQSFAPQQTVVQKHIYVHVPPQEPEEHHAQQILSQGVARKHYKIIFIKTPNVQPSAAQIALQQAQQEEKTIVYVLVKKPEDQGDIHIPQVAPLPPSKPEVYFIKYKANRAQGGGAGHGGAAAATSFTSGGGSAFDSAISSSAVSGGASSGSLPHSEYGAPGGHPGYQ
ncbi:proline-, glutamic acid- and leucine-rich protein 1-like [Topomyia yanbarensis]|uniref:proline-, glutamic acid- and leucine-rich protein 1-like n=1 Tax=Topomyia yanbarensis TaxID=2498891 RepID=UPI00273B175F|nr:proline-, glutamic acid- and leucine-rich protein 1-like [Topomyia yanbarensis]